MALTKSTQSVQSSASNGAGSTTTSSSFATNYGVTGVATITNGSSPPTVACDFVIELSNDGGTTWFEWSRQTAGVIASTSYNFPFSLGIGFGADMGNYRTVFQGNTGQAVTVVVGAETTTALS